MFWFHGCRTVVIGPITAMFRTMTPEGLATAVTRRVTGLSRLSSFPRPACFIGCFHVVHMAGTGA